MKPVFLRSASRGLAVGLAAVSLAACQHLDTVGSDARASGPADPVDTALIDAAERTSRAVEQLGRVSQTRTPPAEVDDFVVPDELKRPVTLFWNGPVVPLLKSLAEEVQYSFTEIGAAPMVPPTVAVEAAGTPAYEVIQTAGLQVGDALTVVLDPDSRRLEVRYD